MVLWGLAPEWVQLNLQHFCSAPFVKLLLLINALYNSPATNLYIFDVIVQCWKKEQHNGVKVPAENKLCKCSLKSDFSIFLGQNV